MDEVDKIILNTFNSIGCDCDIADDELSSFADLSPSKVVHIVTTCIKVISPDQYGHLPGNLPVATSEKFKLATVLAEVIQEIGFGGTVGYQTFLYPAQNDLQKLFMFLIEKLPKDSATGGMQEEDRPALLVHIQKRIQEELCKPWLPRGIRFDGSIHRASGSPQFPTVHQYKKAETVPAKIGAMLQTEVNKCGSMLEQIAPLPSAASRKIEQEHKLAKSKINNFTLPAADDTETSITPANDDPDEVAPEDSLTAASEQFAQNASDIQALRERVLKYATFLEKSGTELNRLLTELDEKQKKVAQGDKIASLMSNPEENQANLESAVEHSSNKLQSISTKWETHKTSLLEQINELKTKNKQQNSEVDRLTMELSDVRERVETTRDERALKEQMYKQLITTAKQVSASAPSRGTYVNKILEIVANIHKQQEQIDSILADTKTVQREINNLTGKSERSFTVTDEMIFLDAKINEDAKRAYRLLAELHEGSEGLISTLEETGAIMRECRDLEEQVEQESSRDIVSKLEMIRKDFYQVKTENTALIKQLKEINSGK